MFSKNNGTPKSSTFNRVFHDFHHPFGVFPPIFGSTPIYYRYNASHFQPAQLEIWPASPVNLPGLNSSGAEWKSGTSAVGGFVKMHDTDFFKIVSCVCFCWRGGDGDRGFQAFFLGGGEIIASK